MIQNRRTFCSFDPKLLLEKWKSERKIDVLRLVKDDILTGDLSFLSKEQRKGLSLILFHKARLEHLKGDSNLARTYAMKSFELDSEREEAIEFSYSITLDKLMCSFESDDSKDVVK